MKKYILSLALMSLASYGMEQEIKIDADDLNQSRDKDAALCPYYFYLDEPNQHIVIRHSISDEQNNLRTVTTLCLDFKTGQIEGTEAFEHPVDNVVLQRPVNVDATTEAELFSRAHAVRAEIKARQHDRWWARKEACRKAEKSANN